MKKSFFSKTIAVVFLFSGFLGHAQVRIKTNTSKHNKKVIVKTNRSTNNYNGGRGRVKTNRNRVVVNKPNIPHVISKRPNYNRYGYTWVEGYWMWNAFYGRYIWQKERWIKIKKNHCWVPGFWEITIGGFFWVEGYWALEF